MNPPHGVRSPAERGGSRQRNHIEQPGEGRKTAQPGQRDPQSTQPADRTARTGRDSPQQ